MANDHNRPYTFDELDLEMRDWKKHRVDEKDFLKKAEAAKALMESHLKSADDAALKARSCEVKMHKMGANLEKK